MWHQHDTAQFPPIMSLHQSLMCDWFFIVAVGNTPRQGSWILSGLCFKDTLRWDCNIYSPDNVFFSVSPAVCCVLWVWAMLRSPLHNHKAPWRLELQIEGLNQSTPPVLFDYFCPVFISVFLGESRSEKQFGATSARCNTISVRCSCGQPWFGPFTALLCLMWKAHSRES